MLRGASWQQLLRQYICAFALVQQVNGAPATKPTLPQLLRAQRCWGEWGGLYRSRSGGAPQLEPLEHQLQVLHYQPFPICCRSIELWRQTQGQPERVA